MVTWLIRLYIPHIGYKSTGKGDARHEGFRGIFRVDGTR